MSIPVVNIASACFTVEGEEGSSQILEEDIITCSLSLLLKRHSHQNTGALLGMKSKNVCNFNPYTFLADVTVYPQSPGSHVR